MKYFCLLFFIFAVQATGSGAITILPSPVMMATVRDLNSGLPKCVGTFVRGDILVTTARCLFCERDCNFEVYVNEIDEGEVRVYKIESTLMHDEFDLDPHRNDIGLIFLKENVTGLTPVELVNKQDPTQLTVISFTGKVVNQFYILEPEDSKALTNAKCTFVTQNYIPDSQICAYSEKRYYFKEQDQGSPLIYFIDNKPHLLGIYATGDFEADQGAKIAVYQRTGPYVEWIERYTKHHSKPICRPRFISAELYNKKV